MCTHTHVYTCNTYVSCMCTPGCIPSTQVPVVPTHTYIYICSTCKNIVCGMYATVVHDIYAYVCTIHTYIHMWPHMTHMHVCTHDDICIYIIFFFIFYNKKIYICGHICIHVHVLYDIYIHTCRNK
jgi:hypothetical protein